jgi:hypothetical protein
MAFRLTHVYLLTGYKLRELCAVFGVESEDTASVASWAGGEIEGRRGK